MKKTRIEGSSTKPRKLRGNSICDFEQYRVLIEEWHPRNYWGPECFGPASQCEVQWICRKTRREHVFFAPISWRTSAIKNEQRHQGCIICSPKKPVTPSESIDEQLSKQWLSKLNAISSKNLSTRSSKLGLWQCDRCAHQWRTKVSSRTSKEPQNCPACFAKHFPQGTVNLNRKENRGACEFFDMEHPRRNAGYDKRKLPKPYKVFWTCSNQKHRWYESYTSLKDRHWLCPKCSKTIDDYPDLKNEYKAQLNEGKKANEITIEKNSGKLFTWKCSEAEDHVWKARLCHRVSEVRKTGCPYCAGRKLSSSNSLIERYPALAGEVHPELNNSIDVKSLTSNSTKKIFWLAKCGHVWQTQVRLRTKRGYGCPKCKRQKSK